MLFITGLAFLAAAPSFPGEPTSVATPTAELALGYKVVNRQVESLDGDNVFLEGERLAAWTAIAGVPAGFVEHLWMRDGVEVARHYLPVGTGRRWRTWSRHVLKAGAYEVRILGPDGAELANTKFTVVRESGC